MPAENTKPVEDDDLESAVGHAIAECDGELRAAIRARVIANNFLTEQIPA